MMPENTYEDRFDRTFAFIDLSGFTRFTDLMGDKAALEEINTFRAIVREIASRKGIRIAKWLGDGAMLVAVEPETLLKPLWKCKVEWVRSMRISQ